MTFRPGDFVPMKCVRRDAPFDDATFRFEPKIDGVRALAYADEDGGVALVARSGRVITHQYPEVARALATALAGVPAVIDGEIAVLNARGVPDFQLLQPREGVTDPRRAERLAEERPAVFFAFDILAAGSVSVVDEPIEARRRLLLDVVGDAEGVRVVTFLPSGGRAAFDAAVAHGFEGVVAKRQGSRYFPGTRSSDWVKLKRLDAADLVVGAWYEGKGALVGTMGALALGAYDDSGLLRYVGRVGTGFTHDERDALAQTLRGLERAASPFADALPTGARHVAPRLVAEVAYHETTEAAKLRAPRFLRLRTDKRPRECLMETELGVSGRV